MFQRQSRTAFPFRNILILAVVVLAFFVYIAKNLQKTPDPAPAGPVGEQDSTEKKQDKGLRPDEWFYAIREYPVFQTDVKTYTDALRQASTTVQSRDNNPGFSAPWTVQGPGNIGARVNTIKTHPTNPNIIYIGYAGGGVWKTTDGGQSWQPIFDQQQFLSIGDIELDPQNPNIVYVGTGDPNISGYPFIGDGLWKSTNGGQSWQHLGLESQRIISKIIVHPTNANILYVATMGLPFERNNDRGLYKSTDGGQNWQQIHFISNETGIIDLEMSPSDPNTLYATAWDRIRNNQESVVSGNNARIWKTSNGGVSWNMLGGGLPDDEKSRIGIDIDKQNANHLVAIYADTSLSFFANYETFNAGQSWQALPTDGLDLGFQSNFAWYFGKIFINPFNSQDIFICGVTLWRSVDGGASWFQTTPEWWTYEVHADMHDMAFVDANTCLLATDGGLYRSTDGGFSWNKIENNPATQFYRVAYNPFFPEWYYGGAQDNGTTAGNADNLTEWPRLFGGDGFQAVFHPEDPNIYYYETQNGKIWGAYDGSGNVEEATIGIDPEDRRHWDMPYLLSRHNPDIMFTGTYRVYWGFGHPGFWEPISEDLTDGVIFGNRFHTISTLDESTLDPDLIYVGTTDANVWRGKPLSQSWTNISSGLPDRYVSSVKASPTISSRVFVSHTGYRDNDFTPRIHRSDNQGDTWTPISGDLPNLAVNDLLIIPGRHDSVIVAATDGGVYATLNGGWHWERLGTNIPYMPVYDVEINPEMKTVFAGTHARSIYSFPLDSLTLGGGDVSTFIPNRTKSPTMSVNPGLVSDYTTIVVEHLKSKQVADLLVYDLSGRIVWQSQCKGYERHDITLDASGLAPGIYIAFARSDGKVWARQKFVVAR